MMASPAAFSALSTTLTQPEARRWAPRDNYAFGEFLTARSLAPRERRAEATAEFIGTGGAGGVRRARPLPQCRERLLRSPRQGTGTPRAGDHRRACGHDFRRRVGHRLGRMGQR